MSDWKDYLQVFLVAVVGMTAIFLLVGYPVKWLWNWLMPMMFDLPEVTFWQAVGLATLSGILFKNTNFKNE